MVLIDLQKAFDTVDHSILCEKLKSIGMSSTVWFKSYLLNHSQCVDIGGTTVCFFTFVKFYDDVF